MSFNLVILIVLPIVLCFAIAGLSLAPWVPLRKKDLPRVLALAKPQAGQVFFELGSGSGRLVRYLARHSQLQCLGLELNPILYLYSKILSLGHPREIFKLKNLFHQDLSSADIVFVFGMPEAINKKLEAKLSKELKPGSKVISYAFAFKNWPALKIDKPSPKDVSIYLYQL